ncbi:MAG: hypothetical protein NZ602_10005 [Thermoguttaceae bacterium]|nr:hypothetical protein [Thermoguttaceae bacterium]MDW8038123.1 hypothetical protein [Thermoguttaceae bacterium]
MDRKRVIGVWMLLGGLGTFPVVGQEWDPWPSPEVVRSSQAVQAVYEEPVEPELLPPTEVPSGTAPRHELQILPERPMGGEVRLNEAAQGVPSVESFVGPIAWAQPPAPPEAPQGVQPPEASKPAAAAKPEAKEEFFTLDELKEEMKKLAWTKGDLKIVPYGSLWGDLLYNSNRTSPGPYTLYVNSFSTDNEHEFIIDARRTRLGLDLSGPSIPWFGGASTGGKLEIDFFGPNAPNPNQGIPFLRHAYLEVKNDEFRFLFGQTWDLASPLFPGVLDYSVGWCGGNIGYRRAQLRLERYLNFSEVFRLELQGALAQNVMPDFAGNNAIDRESADWPQVQGRIGWVIGPRGKGCNPISMGVSAHIGEVEYDFKSSGPAPLNLPPEDDRRFRTWSLNADFRAPITDRLGIQGEFFMGENLSSFLGGIGQGVDLYTRNTIRSYGGWIDLWYDWTDRLHMHVGWGLDDPLNEDFLVGRTYNQFIFVNFLYDITKQFNTGIQVTSWRTFYQDRRAGLVPSSQLGPQRPGEAIVVEWMFRYSF